MCDWHDESSESISYGWSISHGDSVTGDESSDSPSRTLNDFITAPAMYVFKEHLRRAAGWLTVAEFTALRRRYEDIWQEVLADL
jgi:hypothetical protein